MLMRLLWKEWRESRWKLGFGLIVSLAFTVLLFRIRLIPDMGNAVMISIVQVLVVPVIVALDLFAGEMSHGTIHLLFKIPVPRWQIFVSKILTVLAQTVLIFVSTGVMMELMGHGREVDTGMMLRLNGLFALCAVMLLVWFCVFGAQSRSEASSLAVLFAVMIGWAIVWLWSGVCEVSWAYYGVPYVVGQWALQVNMEEFRMGQLLISQALLVVLALTLACYRYVKIRRSL